MADSTLTLLGNIQRIMVISKNKLQQQQNRETTGDVTTPGDSKSKSYKLMGWRNFGLLKPTFKFGPQGKNPAYEKGYN